LNILDRIFNRKSYSIVDLAAEYGLSAPVKSGVRVGKNQALQVSTVFSCLRVLGEGVAQVPVKIMQRTGRNIEPATDHPLYDVLAVQPNDWMSSFELRENMVWHAALRGTAYAFLVRDTRGNVIEIIPLDSMAVTTVQNPDYSLKYTLTSSKGGSRDVPQEAIWALRGPTWNTYTGLDVMQMAREALGLSIAAEDHHARVHKNSANPSGLYSVEGTLNAEQYKGLRAWLDKEIGGVENTGRAMVLDRNAKFTPYAFKGVDMQHLETRKLQIEEVCRYFRMMPIMIGFSDKAATYASAEQMFLAHLVHTLMPWYARFEQSINTQLLSRKDRKAGMYCKFTERALLRGSMKDEPDYIYKLVGMGILTRNEGRELMDRNPIAGLDEPLTPMNLISGDTEKPTQGNANA
jgi:HK97 family phage portal protein